MKLTGTFTVTVTGEGKTMGEVTKAMHELRHQVADLAQKTDTDATAKVDAYTLYENFVEGVVPTAVSS